MPVSSKFLTESTGEKIVKIGQYLAKIWTKYDSLVFWGPPCMFEFATLHIRVYEEVVQGGTPFEKGIQVDPRIGRKGRLHYTFHCIAIYYGVVDMISLLKEFCEVKSVQVACCCSGRASD